MEVAMTKRAVVMGIDDYTGIDASGNSNLNCCVADAASIASLLGSFGFAAPDVTTLTDRAATRDAVMTSLRQMVGQSQPGDVALFYHSGHGSIEPARPNDPACERFYESICT